MSISCRVPSWNVQLVSCATITSVLVLSLSSITFAQTGSVASTTLRPFVISFTPVIGRNGAIGGVSIDASGVVSRKSWDESAALTAAWLKASKPVANELNRTSKLRMVSLGRLESALTPYLDKGDAIPDEMMFLAGLQRVEYVFVYPDSREIVIAGPADGWHLDHRGTFVGNMSKRPVLRLDDLIEAFRNTATSPTKPISCSIDPTEEGLIRLQRLLRSRGLQLNEQTVEQMQETLGPHQIRVTGVETDSHFSHVMVAADYVMKRLAMGLERSPIAGLPSYMELLKTERSRSPRVESPRWWLAVDYDPLRRSPDGLAWQISGAGVKTMTEDGYLSASGRNVNTGREGRLAAQWAAAMTKNYDQLGDVVPVFAELRNCMDLAVVAALVAKHDLASKAGCPSPISESLATSRGPQYFVPKLVDSQASLIRGRRGWFVSVSGGVDIDPWSPLERVEEDPKLAAVRSKATLTRDRRWWWD